MNDMLPSRYANNYLYGATEHISAVGEAAIRPRRCDRARRPTSPGSPTHKPGRADPQALALRTRRCRAAAGRAVAPSGNGEPVVGDTGCNRLGTRSNGGSTAAGGSVPAAG